MEFSHAYLLINEANGDQPEVKQARLVYDVSGGQTVRAFPAGKQPPENAVSAEWNAETLTLACALDDDTTHDLVLSVQEIEDAKNTEAL